MKANIDNPFQELFTDWCGEKPEWVWILPPTASHRMYYRIKSRNYSAIGVYNPNYWENKAFVSMTRLFLAENIPVPQLYGEELESDIYLLEDLGDESLFDVIIKESKNQVYSPFLKALLKRALGELARMQIIGGKKFDFEVCYPYKEFGKESVLYDLKYFQEQFLDQL